jgi:hypothetical protein
MRNAAPVEPSCFDFKEQLAKIANAARNLRPFTSTELRNEPN